MNENEILYEWQDEYGNWGDVRSSGEIFADPEGAETTQLQAIEIAMALFRAHGVELRTERGVLNENGGYFPEYGGGDRLSLATDRWAFRFVTDPIEADE